MDLSKGAAPLASAAACPTRRAAGATKVTYEEEPLNPLSVNPDSPWAVILMVYILVQVVDLSEEASHAAPAAARPARRAAVAANVTYKEELSSEDEEPESDAEGDSDFEASD